MKTLKYALPLTVMALLVFGVGAAFAEDETPPCPDGPGGRGNGVGLLAAYEDDIHQALADALGISLSDFEAARADGQTLANLAATYDVELESLFEAMDTARAEVVAQAVEDGTITQELADWMLAHQGARRGLASQAGMGMHGSGRPR
ncbi:MAG TPA: hypothetical protein VFI11_01030 [Anaerolineales bacterium]|nr:hypothetical protein [Anaerolineales bacterium]